MVNFAADIQLTQDMDYAIIIIHHAQVTMGPSWSIVSVPRQGGDCKMEFQNFQQHRRVFYFREFQGKAVMI